MPFKYNPFTGELDYYESGSGGTSYPYKVEKFTLDATDISNKYVVLNEAPTVKPLARMIIIGGVEQAYGVDFEVTTDDADKRVSWNGLGLDGFIEVGDKIVIVYT
jgi:hypothetical protein